MGKFKAIMIVLDGLSNDLISEGFRDGWLPNLSKIARSGVVTPVHSTIPPDTGAAATTLFTGTDPKTHGVFANSIPVVRGDALHIEPSSLMASMVPTLFDMANETDFGIAGFGIPLLRPVPRVRRGFVVPGFGVPDRISAYPNSIQRILESEGFTRDVPPGFYSCPGSLKVKILVERIKQTGDLFLELLSKLNEKIDLAVLWVPETDRAGHTLWLRRESMRRVYRAADELVGRIVETYGSDENMIVVTGDHGFKGFSTKFYPNFCLMQSGLLKLNSGMGMEIRKLITKLAHSFAEAFSWLGGLAFGALDAAFWRGRPNPLSKAIRRILVEYWDVDISSSEVIAVSGGTPFFLLYSLRELTQVGQESGLYHDYFEKITADLCIQGFTSKVYPAEEIYRSRYPTGRPVAVVEVKNGVYPSSRISESLRGYWRRSRGGMHDILTTAIFAGPNIQGGRVNQGFHLRDILPTLLYGIGFPIWNTIEGDVHEEIFTEKMPLRRKSISKRTLLRSKLRGFQFYQRLRRGSSSAGLR